MYIHVLNRGVDKRRVFMDSQDYARFVHDMYVFNNKQEVPQNIKRTLNVQHRMLNIQEDGTHKVEKVKLRASQASQASQQARKELVKIHAFCLMPNHYHMLLTPTSDESLSLFMKRMNMGYSKYFNERYDRSGALWQGKYRKIIIEKDAHFLHVPHYIHANPLDISHPKWRERKVENQRNAWESLMRYKWSSLPDYVGIRNFPSVLFMDDLKELFRNPKSMQKEIFSLMSDDVIENIKIYNSLE